MSNILVIEDSSLDRSLVSNMLSEAGFNVTLANSGMAGIKVAQSSQPDLILLDINLPDINGIEVCRFFRAREQSKNIPILFLSALNVNDLKAAAIESGGSDFISKPFRKAILLSRVNAHLELTSLKIRMQVDDQRFFDIYNLAPIGIAQIDLEGQWLNANVHLLNLLGYSLEKLREHRVQYVTTTLDFQNAMLQLASKSREAYEEDNHLIAKNGDVIKANIKVKLVLNNDGSPHYLIAVISEFATTKQSQ